MGSGARKSPRRCKSWRLWMRYPELRGLAVSKISPGPRWSWNFSRVSGHGGKREAGGGRVTLVIGRTRPLALVAAVTAVTKTEASAERGQGKCKCTGQSAPVKLDARTRRKCANCAPVVSKFSRPVLKLHECNFHFTLLESVEQTSAV